MSNNKVLVNLPEVGGASVSGLAAERKINNTIFSKNTSMHISLSVITII